jgi:hypothetical protein
MRAVGNTVLAALMIGSILFLIGYGRNVYSLHIVRPDPGIRIIFEPRVDAFFDYENDEHPGFHLNLYFPPEFENPLDSVQVFQVPCWLVAAAAICTMVYTGFMVLQPGVGPHPSADFQRRWHKHPVCWQ